MLDPRLPAPKFTLEETQAASETWGLNCGPAAVAVAAGLTLDELRPHLGEFEVKGYTNPKLMWQILRNLNLRWKNTLQQCSSENQGMLAWPEFGLARVQWEGPWTAPGVPMRVRYRHTHWVAAMSITSPSGVCDSYIFDVNCICVGGWVTAAEWSGSVVPWLLQECQPKANGRWHLTHIVEIERGAK